MKIWIIIAVEMLLFAVLLFGGAGTLAWPSGWIFLLLMFGMAIWITMELAKHDPGLVAERLKPCVQKDQARWDQILMPIIMIVFPLWLVLMGVDAVRFRWSAVPRWLQTVGAVGFVWSMWIQYLVLRENSFAAPVVKIQSARGHRVISTGPYAIVRHPMYSAVFVFFAGTALLLGSWWGLLASLVLDALIVLRTALEDHELQERLPGYADYARRVRYRLVPEIW
jgi:protein-S-isoprenylcysteine O-methyltransferase Ste14